MNTITQDGWMLIDEVTGWPVQLGEVRTSFRGETWSIVGGRPPQHAASTGRVWVRPVGAESGRITEYFPDVMDAQWHDMSKINQKQLTSDYTFQGVHLMRQRGGGFAAALADAFFRADLGNRQRLVQAFEDLIGQYAQQAQEEIAA